MKYREIVDGIFVDRPNRFIAYVEMNGAVETVHVKNTGRCRELLLPGTAVRLEVSDNPKRKTKYDLVAVRKQELGWVNMDSQAPNKVVGEWLAKQGYDYIKPEFTYGKSRIDFYMEKGEQKYLMEVKGCTLEVDQYRLFPGCTHRAGGEAPARAGTGTADRISVRCGLCDSDGRHHRGAAKCQHTAGVWHGTGRSKGCRCASAVFALPCRAG